MVRVNSINQVLREAKQRLRFHKTSEVDLAAEVILSHILNLDRTGLYREPERRLTRSQYHAFNRLIKSYFAGTPLVYLTGKKEFMSLDFKVTPAVLIPRPETELLVEEALRLLTTPTPKTFGEAIANSESASSADRLILLDIGTGCGNIAVSVARLAQTPRLKVFASDISEAALKVARQNVRRHGVSKRITFRQGDLFEAFRGLKLKGRVDLILSNPPYVSITEYTKLSSSIRRYEPRMALYAGRTGLEFYQRIIKEASDYLKPGGYLLLEMGLGQARSLQQILAKSRHFDSIKILRDYQGIERVITAQLKNFPCVIASDSEAIPF